MEITSMIEHLEQEENEQLPIRPRPCSYSFKEWLKIRIGHNNLHESNREFIFNEWILDSYDVEEEYAREIGDPYSRIFDEYNRVFKNEIEHLSNEYILRIGKKGYVLEDEMWRITDYDPPYVNIETFEVKEYSFKGGRSFICITNREDEALPLGCVNGAWFKAMIRKELEGHNSYGVTTTGIKSLREDEDNLIDSRLISNLEAMLMEFLVLILLFSYLFHFLNVQ
ncbi:hypothetical protein Tco_0622159 [Tanacetum coccineum]